jgi:peptide/nickel transport system ATP-binding protein
VEEGTAATMYNQPLHPYTQRLLNAAPVPDPERQRERREARLAQRVDPSDGGLPNNGCAFASRCPHASDACRGEEPQLTAAGNGGRVACHHWREISGAYARRSADRESEPVGAGGLPPARRSASTSWPP